jgi:hypothetical protein
MFSDKKKAHLKGITAFLIKIDKNQSEDKVSVTVTLFPTVALIKP